MSSHDPKSLRTAPLATPTDLKTNAIKDISRALNILLADMFALYIKTRLPPAIG
jgi:starvation-inducible DNA-binding protein